MFGQGRKSKGRLRSFGSKHASFERRNALILESLPKQQSWVLDVGSNLGDTSNYLAEEGHVVLGIEKMEPEYRRALAGANPMAAFLCTGATPAFMRSTVDWDAILLLSVLHRLYAFEDETFMRDVLFECGQKSAHLFIEGSTRHERYSDHGSPAPDFPDLDVAASDAWHQALFRDVLGNGWSVPEGVRLECSKAEPYRLFYHLQRKSD